VGAPSPLQREAAGPPFAWGRVLAILPALPIVLFTRGATALLTSELLYLSVHLLQQPTQYILEPRPLMVGKVVSQQARLFQEHAHVAQFGDLRLCHVAVVWQGTTPFLYEARAAPQLVYNWLRNLLIPIHPSA
jgi:hypothetical protein